MKLNLEAKNKQEELILSYLQQNASETLADKINNGSPFEKDGKPLLNKKTLSGFMKYACNEARNLAEKGANSACVDDATVYGWAIHYFEEDSIEGTLYTIDGEKYKSAPKKTFATKPVVTKTQKQQNFQFSLFDDLTEQNVNGIEKTTLTSDTEENDADDEGEPQEEKVVDTNDSKASVYEKYQALQVQYPSFVVAYRLGDFYEIMGEYAVEIANEIDLTLTSRDCGLKERIPMVGFPYHASENYFDKVAKTHNILVVEANGETRVISKNKPQNLQVVDLNTGEILKENKFRDNDIINNLLALFGNNIEVR